MTGRWSVETTEKSLRELGDRVEATLRANVENKIAEVKKARSAMKMWLKVNLPRRNDQGSDSLRPFCLSPSPGDIYHYI